MLVSNFDYLYNGDLPNEIGEICQKAETEYIYGNYDTCCIRCRQAAEFITKWTYKEEILFPLPMWYKDDSKFADLLKAKELIKGIGDLFLIKEADQYIRIAGNAAVHSLEETSFDVAARSLKTLFKYITGLHNKIYEYQYDKSFIEPYFYDENAAPLERDYDKLIDEETDPEVRAKLALLKKCGDADFDIVPFTDVLPDESGIKRLIAVLSDTKLLRKILSQSSTQLRSMISSCYRGFDYREEDAVIAYGINACRHLVRVSFKSIRQFTDEYSSIAE